MAVLSGYLPNLNFVKALTSCVNTNVKTFLKDEYIMNYGLKKQSIGLVLKGTAEIIKIDENGQTNILESLSTGSIFSELFMSYTQDSISVICRENSEILFIDYNTILKDCQLRCPNHINTLRELFQLMLNKTVTLNEKISVLSKKTTQEKIIDFLEIEQEKSDKRNVTLPFSYQDFANYLSVDRSSLMRELKKMQDEKIIKKDGRKIYLYKQ